MSWVERDGPPVRPPERQGFGTAVIDSMAKLAVDGVVRLDYAPAGLAWHLTCPAANALESATTSTKAEAALAKEETTSARAS